MKTLTRHFRIGDRVQRRWGRDKEGRIVKFNRHFGIKTALIHWDAIPGDRQAFKEETFTRDLRRIR